MRRHLSLLILCIVCTACGGHDEDSGIHDNTPTRASDTLRPPSGATPETCEGSSIDPPQEQLRFLHSAHTPETQNSARIRLEAMVGEYSRSATLRVFLGELLLQQQPASPGIAMRRFERALQLHEQGCRLDALHSSKAYEGLALSHIMQGDYQAAMAPLHDALNRWPTLRSARYNLACALCQTGALDDCARELQRVIQSPDAPVPDTFEELRRPPGYFRRLAARDPDLAPLRTRDPDAFDALLR